MPSPAPEQFRDAMRRYESAVFLEYEAELLCHLTPATAAIGRVGLDDGSLVFRRAIDAGGAPVDGPWLNRARRSVDAHPWPPWELACGRRGGWLSAILRQRLPPAPQPLSRTDVLAAARRLERCACTELVVRYAVPVQVEIAREDARIRRVIVRDDQLRAVDVDAYGPDGRAVGPVDPSQPLPPRTAADAVLVADATPWPTWSLGL